MPSDPVNDAPVWIEMVGGLVSEGAAPGTDAGITFSAITGTINGLPSFVVDGDQLKVGTSDVGISGAWGITLRATDSVGLFFDQSVIICNTVVNPACAGGLARVSFRR